MLLDWYEKWLSEKVADHTLRAISASDGSLVTVAAAPDVDVNLWVKYVPVGPPETHYGYNPGMHQHDGTSGQPGPYTPYYDFLGDDKPAYYSMSYNKPTSVFPGDGLCSKAKERAELNQNIHAFVPQCNDRGKFKSN